MLHKREEHGRLISNQEIKGSSQIGSAEGPKNSTVSYRRIATMLHTTNICTSSKQESYRKHMAIKSRNELRCLEFVDQDLAICATADHRRRDPMAMC